MMAAVLPTLLPGFVGTTLPDWLKARLRAGLGGVCLFATNIESLSQLRTLTDAIYAENPRAIVAIDEEGGDVTRLFARDGSPSPGNAVLGRIDDLDTTAYAARQIGIQLRQTGVRVNFAPSVDINSNPDNPVIGVRSFGDRADQVARHGAAWIRGLLSTGVAATAKHFPGHGDTALDSHHALPIIDRSPSELEQRELVPFAAAIEARVRAVMTSHILLPQLDAEQPATLSNPILGGLLRTELGFDGVIVSDALDMAGVQTRGGIGETAPDHWPLGATCSASAPTTPTPSCPPSRRRWPAEASRRPGSRRRRIGCWPSPRTWRARRCPLSSSKGLRAAQAASGRVDLIS